MAVESSVFTYRCEDNIKSNTSIQKKNAYIAVVYCGKMPGQLQRTVQTCYDLGQAIDKINYIEVQTVQSMAIIGYHIAASVLKYQ